MMTAAGSAAALRGRSQAAAQPSPGPGDRPWDLAKEFPYASLYGISPDGKRFLFNFSHNPIRTFSYDGKWGERIPRNSNGDGLRVIEATSWRTDGSLQLRQSPLRGSFFSDGEALYVETQAILEGEGKVALQRVVIDLQTRKVEERVEPVTVLGIRPYYVAVGDRSLLGFVYDDASASTIAIIKAEAGSYREISRVPFAAERATGLEKYELDPGVSGDRRVFVTAFDNQLAYRRTSDLSLVWQRRTDGSVRAWQIAIAHGGDLIAAYFADVPPARRDARTQYIQVFDGADGAPVTKLALGAIDYLALSPDRRLMAVTKRAAAPNKPSETELAVDVYEISSGKRVAAMVHERINGSHQFIRGSVKPWFTSDGKYLITSGLQSKVWSVSA